MVNIKVFMQDNMTKLQIKLYQKNHYIKIWWDNYIEDKLQWYFTLDN